MTFYVENETEREYSFDVQSVIQSVGECALRLEKCPYEKVSVDVVLTDNEGIHEINRQYRGIDAETDVLSFPNLEFEQPGVFDLAPEELIDYMDPETDTLVLGDIMLNVDRIDSQALEYGHSQKRELAFLVAHSMLHLCGYDHMEPEEAAVMEARQEAILQELGITRDSDN